MGNGGRASASGVGGMSGRGGGTETDPPSAGASLRPLRVREAGVEAGCGGRGEGGGGGGGGNKTHHHMLSGHLRLQAGKNTFSTQR